LGIFPHRVPVSPYKGTDDARKEAQGGAKLKPITIFTQQHFSTSLEVAN
jgi:hypothetical protein